MKFKIALILLLCSLVYAQGSFEPVESDVYDYLERQSLNGIIFFHNEIKPITRVEVARYLSKIDEQRFKLNDLDRDLLDFYMIDFNYELYLISDKSEADKKRLDTKPEFFIYSKARRMKFFEYAGEDFAFFADPILSGSIQSIAGEQLLVRRNGFSTYGYVADNWMYDVSFYDNEESGKNLNIYKQMTPERGTSVTKIKKDAFEYDVVNASVGYYWNIGSLTLGKEYYKFGNGRMGNVILSDKAPSFPFLRFDIYPVEWLRFFYFHGALVSNVIDSARIRTSPVENRESKVDVPKFIAFHSISFYPGANVSLTLGESIVYSEYFQPIYLIPVIFFRVADHYLSKGTGSSTGNAQIFADASYANTNIKTKFYGSIFIDELSINDILSGGNLSALGYTVGIETRDLLIDNSRFTVEYTRINPFVYMNSVAAQSYANDDYVMGHWIGSNGDLISLIYSQYVLRSISFNAQLNYLRKGKIESPEEQYSSPYPPFLYGERMSSTSCEFNIKYKPFNPVVLQAYYCYEDLVDINYARVPDYRLGKNSYFGFTISYGLL